MTKRDATELGETARRARRLRVVPFQVTIVGAMLATGGIYLWIADGNGYEKVVGAVVTMIGVGFMVAGLLNLAYEFIDAVRSR